MEIEDVPSRWALDNMDKAIDVTNRLVGKVWVSLDNDSWCFYGSEPVSKHHTYRKIGLHDVLVRMYYPVPRGPLRTNVLCIDKATRYLNSKMKTISIFKQFFEELS